jgi:hypothetical protein
LTRVSQYTCLSVWHMYANTHVKPFDTCIGIHVSVSLTRVYQYTCQTVQLMTCTSDTRLTRVKMHVSNCLTRVRHCTRVKLHVAIWSDFCSDIFEFILIPNGANCRSSEPHELILHFFQFIMQPFFLYINKYIKTLSIRLQ